VTLPLKVEPSSVSVKLSPWLAVQPPNDPYALPNPNTTCVGCHDCTIRPMQFPLGGMPDPAAKGAVLSLKENCVP